MIQSGRMRHRVRIEQQTETQDGAGQPLNTWTLVAERWAELVRTPGSEVWASAQRQGRVPVVFKLRYLHGVRPAMRLIFDGKIHNILSAPDPTGLKEELIITTEEDVEAAA